MSRCSMVGRVAGRVLLSRPRRHRRHRLRIARGCRCLRRHLHTLPHSGREVVVAHIDPMRQIHSIACHASHGRASGPVPARGSQCVAAAHSVTASPKTESILGRLGRDASGAGGAGGSTTLDGLRAADRAWQAMRTGPGAPPAEFVRGRDGMLGQRPGYDVVVCGGTLGIFLAAALQARGLRVCVVERGPLRGREQEWNISRAELRELWECGVVDRQAAEGAIRSEFNPNRVAFHERCELWTTDILNIGVSPEVLVAEARRAFEEAGGVVRESTAVAGVDVFADGVAVNVAGGENRVMGELLIDCMGHGSPIVRQYRGTRKPDGVCMVVGTVASGFQNNQTSDVIATVSDAQPPGDTVADAQVFWEAFPAGSGPTDRTTYMFTYMDAEAHRHSLEEFFDLYWDLMPRYQGVTLEDIEVKRALFGVFPTFRDSPLRAAHDRVLQVGDASGIQSPLSFGGFGALLRHLPRTATAVDEAVRWKCTDRASLGLINAYNPGLSASWLFQRAMSIRKGQRPSPAFVNRLLGSSFASMQGLGDPVLRPFLQDVIQFDGLTRALLSQMASDPLFIPQILLHVGPEPLADWLRHYLALGSYTALARAADAVNVAGLVERLPPRQRFRLRRAVEGWRYGAGLDFFKA